MKRKKFLTGLVVLGTVSLLFSCGGGGGSSDPNSGQTPTSSTAPKVLSKTKITQQTYSSLQTSLSSATSINMPSMPSNIGVLSIRKAGEGGNENGSYQNKETAKWTCSKENLTGNTNDSDGDGVPVDILYDFECSINPNNVTTTWKGKISLQDNNDNDVLSGYKLCTGTFNNNNCSREEMIIQTQAQNTTWTGKQVIDVSFDKNGNDYTFSTYYFKYTSTSSLPEYPDQTAILEGSNIRYTPDDWNDPWSAGTWNGTFTEKNTDPVITPMMICTTTLTAYHIGSCQAGIPVPDSGTISVECNCPGNSNKTMTATIEFTGCGQGSVTETRCDGTTTDTTFNISPSQ